MTRTLDWRGAPVSTMTVTGLMAVATIADASHEVAPAVGNGRFRVTRARRPRSTATPVAVTSATTRSVACEGQRILDCEHG